MSRGNRVFDPQSILDEDDRVPVEFQTAAYKLGHLDESSGMVVRARPGVGVRSVAGRRRCDCSRARLRTLAHPPLRPQDIEENQRLELPLWLAEPLARRNLITVDVPRNYSSKVRATAARPAPRALTRPTHAPTPR